MILVLLALGVAAYLVWKWNYTSLTSQCRWRQSRSAGDWHCLYCGARTVTEGNRAPRHCLRPR